MKLISKTILAGLAAVTLAWASAATAQQETAQNDPEGARQFVSQLSQDAINVLNDISMTQDERDSAFRALLKEGFDLSYIGKLVLGRHWRNASRDQRAEYDEIFPEYVLRIYAGRLNERGDEEFQVLDTVPAGKRDVYVRSEVVRPDGPPVAADWRVRKQDGEFKIVDLKIEGISMVLTQRDEFAARVSQVGIDGLLQDIRNDARMNQPAQAGQL